MNCAASHPPPCVKNVLFFSTVFIYSPPIKQVTALKIMKKGPS
uniref:Uncharacterized protein n=1 Tax=Anguilla anguilla TaxID=7936 RepID=A0A0E9WA50_ANGAN